MKISLISYFYYAQENYAKKSGVISNTKLFIFNMKIKNDLFLLIYIKFVISIPLSLFFCINLPFLAIKVFLSYLYDLLYALISHFKQSKSFLQL